MKYILLIIGLILLIKGADYFVDGSSRIAKVFNIPSVIIGMTIVALGTSLPEFSVSLISVINNSSNLSISNIVGSNMFNLFLILGICSLFCNFKIEDNDYKFLLLSGIGIIVISIFYHIFNGNYMIGRIGGLLLVFLLIYYIGSNIRKINNDNIKEKWNNKNILLLIIGLVMLVIGGKLVVDNAIIIAKSIGVSERVIGLTIVAIGTSLPELFTSIIALIKNDKGIAVGNIIGSNILNFLFIGGISSLLLPIGLSIRNIMDLIIYVFGMLLVMFKRDSISKRMGLFMILFYVIYYIYVWIM